MSTDVEAIAQIRADDPAVTRFRAERQRQLVRGRVRRGLVIACQLAIIGAFIGVWQFAITTGLANPTFVGTPSEMFSELWLKTVDGTFIRDAVPTFSAVVVAFVLASVVGTLVGVVMNEFPFVDRVLQPLVSLVNSVPRIALAPMLIVWFGLGMSSKVVLAFSLVVFIQLVATESALKNVDEYLLLLSRSLGCSRWQTFASVKIPWALPGIFGGFRLGMVYSVLSVVVSEMIASPDGLGQKIAYYSNTFAISTALATLLFLSIVTLVLVQIINVVESKLGTWQ